MGITYVVLVALFVCAAIQTADSYSLSMPAHSLLPYHDHGVVLKSGPSTGETTVLTFLKPGACFYGAWKNVSKYIQFKCTAQEKIRVLTFDPTTAANCIGNDDTQYDPNIVISDYEFKDGEKLVDIYGDDTLVSGTCAITNEYDEEELQAFGTVGRIAQGPCSGSVPGGNNEIYIAHVFAKASPLGNYQIFTTDYRGFFYPCTNTSNPTVCNLTTCYSPPTNPSLHMYPDYGRSTLNANAYVSRLSFTTFRDVDIFHIPDDGNSLAALVIFIVLSVCVVVGRLVKTYMNHCTRHKGWKAA